MERYENRSGRSNVNSFEIDNDSIKVAFKDGSVYLYNYASTGVLDVERMKQLAVSGSGLNGFIGKVVKKRYAAQLR